MLENPQSAQVRAYFFLSVTTLCWGANTVFAKLAVGEVSPMMLIMWRWLGVVLIVLPITAPQIKQEWPTLKLHLGYLAAMGALGFTAFNALFYIAAHSTTALNMGILQGTIPVFVMLSAYVAFRTKVSVLQLIGVSITLIGVVLVALEGNLLRLQEFAFNQGDLMIITACLLYSIYAVWLRKKPEVSALVWFAMLGTAAFLATLPMAALEWYVGASQWPSPTGWLLIAGITLLPSLLAQVLFIKGVELIGPGRSGVFVNLVPILASIAAVLFLNEVFRWFHGAALGLVLSGIWIAERWAPEDNR
ncbi:MAG: DMT family transporter [Pseudomonadota bacterium]